MALKVFLATFVAVAFAELADKTQLVGIGMSAKSNRPLLVWLGSISAYMVVTAISVLIGATFGKHIRPELIRFISASLFVIIGILMFTGKI
jgi:putative Ca2+/H+ antiporter (TMEM165/GDT1 family)